MPQNHCPPHMQNVNKNIAYRDNFHFTRIFFTSTEFKSTLNKYQRRTEHTVDEWARRRGRVDAGKEVTCVPGPHRASEVGPSHPHAHPIRRRFAHPFPHPPPHPTRTVPNAWVRPPRPISTSLPTHPPATATSIFNLHPPTTCPPPPRPPPAA